MGPETPSNNTMALECMGVLATVFAIETVCSPSISVGDRDWLPVDRAMHIIGTNAKRGTLGFLHQALVPNERRQTS